MAPPIWTGGLSAEAERFLSVSVGLPDKRNPESSMRAENPPVPNERQLNQLEELLSHFEQMEAQFQLVQESLTRSHRLATMGAVAAMVAHEFNNLLAPIIRHSQLALSEPSDQELMKKAVEKALSGAEQAAHICSSMLGFARDVEQPTIADLRQTIDEAIGCLGRDPAKDKIKCTIDVPHVQVAMSPANLQQVLINLILNARQTMKSQSCGGALILTARTQDNAVLLDVKDTGPGIPPTIADRIFEPFVSKRAGAKDHCSGSGLGLCICRDLIRHVGGRISVTSEHGQGATFHLEIPLAA